MRRVLTWGAGAVVLVVAAVLLLGGGGGRTLRIDLASANGLREGSPVRMGGVKVGSIDKLRIGKDDVPQAVVKLDDGTTVGAGARAEVITSNLLGAKYLQVYPGRLSDPLRDGATIPVSRVSTPTDLDQVLNALTPDVRARLQVLINEAGTWMTGRRGDFRKAMALLPQDLDAGTQLLDRVVTDNTSLRTLVARSSSLVRRLAPERREVAGFVDAAGRATAATAAQREDLAQTLRSAPATLRSASRALDELDRTAAPLGPAARSLSAAAPGLRQTLAALPVFESAARPTLREARAVAPQLSNLGDRATPVVRRATPALRELASLVRTAAPVSSALRVSVDDALGLIEGWARSIQTRDTVSHLFRGRASVGPESMRSILSRLPNSPAARRSPAKHARPSGDRPAAPAAPSLRPDVKPLLPKLPKALQESVDGVLGSVGGLLGGLTGRQQSGPDRTAPRDSGVSDLLDYLLGQ